MAPPGLAGFFGREDLEELEAVELREVLEVFEVLAPLGGLEAAGELAQPESIRLTPTRIPRLDSRRLRAMVEILFSAFTVSAW